MFLFKKIVAPLFFPVPLCLEILLLGLLLLWFTRKQKAGKIIVSIGVGLIILVTTASHMPRSMALFKKRDMQPIPAPIDHSMKRRQRINPGVFFPNSAKIRNAEEVFYEYLGLAWAKLRGQM